MDDDSNHTCDACGPAVKARAVIILANNGFLAYCAHHVNRWRKNLETQGATIYPIEE